MAKPTTQDPVDPAKIDETKPPATPADAQATPPADPKPEKPIRDLTDEELKAQEDEFISRAYMSQRPKKAAAIAEPPPAEPKTEPATPPAVPPKEPPKAPPAAPAEPEATVEPPPPIEEFRSRMPKGETQAAAEPAKSEIDQLPAKHKEHIRVLQRMAKDNPEQYAGLDSRYVQTLKREADYINKWLGDNPTRKFSSRDEEHQEFYAGNNLEFDDFDYKQADRALLREEARRDAKAEARTETEKVRSERTIQEAQRTAEQSSYMAVTDYIAQADPEGLGKFVVKDPNGGVRLENDAPTKMKEEDPIAYRLMVEDSAYLMAMVHELELFRAGDGKYAPARDKTVDVRGQEYPVVRNLESFIARTETAKLKLPASATVRDGKRLISAVQSEEFISSVAGDKTLTKEQKGRAMDQFFASYYTLSLDDYRQELVADHAKKTSDKINEFRAHYTKPKAKGTPSASDAPPATTAKPASIKASATSVSTASSSDKLEDRLGPNDSAKQEVSIGSSRAFNV